MKINLCVALCEPGPSQNTLLSYYLHRKVLCLLCVHFSENHSENV